MNSKDIPYGSEFELTIPCDPEAKGYLSINIDAEGTYCSVEADDCEGNHASIYIASESQALMIIAAMNVLICKLRAAKDEDK